MAAFLAPITLAPRHHRTHIASRSPVIPRVRVPMATLDVKGAERAQEILAKLLASNTKYMAGQSEPQSELSSPTLRADLATNGQKPVAAVIACADSRVAPEIVFGAGLGQVFTIRNAGNVAWGDSVVGSLEYAVTALGVPLVIVLGHTMCGAVGAAVEAAKNGGGGTPSPLANHVGRIAEVVKPVAQLDDATSKAVVENVKDGVTRLLHGESEVAKYARNKDIAVVGAVYDIMTGKVSVVS